MMLAGKSAPNPLQGRAPKTYPKIVLNFEPSGTGRPAAFLAATSARPVREHRHYNWGSIFLLSCEFGHSQPLFKSLSCFRGVLPGPGFVFCGHQRRISLFWAPMMLMAAFLGQHLQQHGGSVSAFWASRATFSRPYPKTGFRALNTSGPKTCSWQDLPCMHYSVQILRTAFFIFLTGFLQEYPSLCRLLCCPCTPPQSKMYDKP